MARMNDTFTVIVINLLPVNPSPRTILDIRTQFEVLYKPRIEGTLKQRGIYSTGTIGVTVNFKMVTLSPDDKDGTNRQTITGEGHAYVILCDLEMLDTAKQLREEIENEDGVRFIPVVLKTVKMEHIVMSTLSEDSESDPGVGSSLLVDAFENLCSVVETEAGSIVPPKKARSYSRPTKR